MSEYQYYEFRAIDRPLTEEEQAAVGKLSSRVDLSPTHAIFVYNYSDFPARAEEILARYFDAMLYMANWGSCHLRFRFPKNAVDLEQTLGEGFRVGVGAHSASRRRDETPEVLHLVILAFPDTGLILPAVLSRRRAGEDAAGRE